MTVELKETFAEDLAKLSDLLQRDPIYWINSPVPSQKQPLIVFPDFSHLFFKVSEQSKLKKNLSSTSSH